MKNASQERAKQALKQEQEQEQGRRADYAAANLCAEKCDQRSLNIEQKPLQVTCVCVCINFQMHLSGIVFARIYLTTTERR